MRDIGVVNAPSGAPTLKLTGGALVRLESLVPDGYRPLVHLTLTDDHPWAQAFVITEAVPAGRQGHARNGTLKGDSRIDADMDDLEPAKTNTGQRTIEEGGKKKNKTRRK